MDWKQLTTPALLFVPKSAGVYLLGERQSVLPLLFDVRYVGRSDDDLAARLAKWVSNKYTHFVYWAKTTAVDAFHEECRFWHDLGGPERKLDNEIHPARPAGSNVACRVCGA